MTFVDVHIVTWNSLEVLPVCLQSVYNQDFPNFRVTIVDNASEDGTLEFLRQHYPQVTVLANNQNLGFSKAHNMAIRQSTAPYVLILNPDVFLSSSYLSQAAQAMQDSLVGAVAGRVYVTNKIDFIARQFSNNQLLDCAGLNILKSRRLVLRGHFEDDSPEFDRSAEVFGTDGAVALYRRATLEDVKIEDEYFDEDFFAYKEDHDLAWRTRLLGWKTLYVPGAKAYHIRSVRPGQRRNMKSEIRLLGVSNRYLMMMKNDLFSLMVRDLLHIFFYEMKIFFYLLVFEWASLPAYFCAIQLLPKMQMKRNLVMARKRIAARDLSHWFI